MREPAPPQRRGAASPSAEQRHVPAAPSNAPAPAQRLIALQRAAGNRAVAAAIAAQRAGARPLQRARVVRGGAVVDVADDAVRPDDALIVRAGACHFRFQNPSDVARGGKPEDPAASRVSTLDFDATEAAVDHTIGDYGNASGTNAMLWLSGSYSLWYAGIRRDPHVNIVPQERLADPQTQVTIILPQAAVERVEPSREAAQTPYGNVQAYGLRGAITPDDRLWTTAGMIRHSLENATASPLPAGHMEFQLLTGRRLIIDLLH